MFAAVWLLYATDRILDARLLETGSSSLTHLLEARHRFHHRHRRVFLTGIVIASVALAALLPRLDPEAVKLYLIEGSFLAGYFILVHATRAANRLPKELAVGLFFSAAVFIPTIVRRPEIRPTLIIPALLFAALCSLNCLYIYAWEHPSALRSPLSLRHEMHPATLFILRHLKGITLALLIAALLVTLLVSSAIPSAVVTSTLALVLLDRQRYRLSRTTLRAAADLALLTPLLLLLQ